MFVLESQVYIREKKVSNLFPKVVYYLLISNADFDMGFQNESFLFLWAIPASSHGLFSVLCSVVTLGSAQGIVCGAKDRIWLDYLQDKYFTPCTSSRSLFLFVFS